MGFVPWSRHKSSDGSAKQSAGRSKRSPEGRSRRTVAARALAKTTLTALLFVHRPAQASVISSAIPPPEKPEVAKPGSGVSFSGRVVELGTGNSVADASIVVDRLVRGADPQSSPPWAGLSTIWTDRNGRFQLAFPPEQVADRRVTITLRVSKPGFISRKSWEMDLTSLLSGKAMGDPPFFETITIEKGIEYTALVVTPAGKPAVGVPCLLVNCVGSNNLSAHFADECRGQTDTDGRLRLRMQKSHGVALYVMPPQPTKARFPYAPYQHFYGTAQPDQHPDVWAPTDLGRIVLERGVQLSGQLVDLEGRPIARQTIKAYPVRGEDRHSATTEADGSFILGPLRTANYRIFGDGDNGGNASVDPFALAILPTARVIKPVKVYMQKDVVPEPLVLREMPTVQVEAEFVDSQGRPALGGATRISGLIPNAQGMSDPFGNFCSFEDDWQLSVLNDLEPQDTSDRMDWGVRGRPDADGRIVFRVPEGMQHTAFEAFPSDETIAYKTREEVNGPLNYWGSRLLGTIEKDRKITIVSYRRSQGRCHRQNGRQSYP